MGVSSTDAKITSGNSGGAAINTQGKLIGVPTTGHHYSDEALYEEQLWIRPINLAWELIEANIPSIKRDNDLIPTESSSGQTAPQSSIQIEGNPSGDYGIIALDSEKNNSIVSRSNEGLSYHTYVLTVPQDASQVMIEVITNGENLDLAVKVGSKIISYKDEGGDYDFKDFTEDPNPRYTISSPQSDRFYIDVVNPLYVPVDYTLRVTSLGPPENTQTNPSEVPQDIPEPTLTPFDSIIFADNTSSGTVGSIAIGQVAMGKLAGPNGSYHTYMLYVPTGIQQIVVSLSLSLAGLDLTDLDQDFGLAIKYNGEISNYLEQNEGGNWDYRSSSGLIKEISILNPKEGTWYIDVYVSSKDEIVGEYILSVFQ